MQIGSAEVFTGDTLPWLDLSQTTLLDGQFTFWGYVLKVYVFQCLYPRTKPANQWCVC